MYTDGLKGQGAAVEIFTFQRRIGFILLSLPLGKVDIERFAALWSKHILM